MTASTQPIQHREVFYVHIIESPGQDDLLDGNTEGRVLTEGLRISRIPAAYYLAVSKKMLWEALVEKTSEHVQSTNLLPLFHISAHGSQQGFVLTSGEMVTWNEFSDWLHFLGDRCGRLLPILCMSSCKGYSAIQIAMNDKEKQPVWGILGPGESPRWDEAALAYQVFYFNLFRGIPPADAANVMTQAVGHRFFFSTAEEIQNGWIEYQREQNLQRLLEQYRSTTQMPSYGDYQKNAHSGNGHTYG